MAYPALSAMAASVLRAIVDPRQSFADLDRAYDAATDLREMVRMTIEEAAARSLKRVRELQRP